MLQSNFSDFFVASVGAASAFIGLLFVGLTVAAGRPGQDGVSSRDQFLAESAFTALLNVLFISFVGLIPGSSFGGVFFVLGFICLLTSSLRIFRHDGGPHRTKRRFLGGMWLIVIYLIEAIYGAYLIFSTAQYVDETTLIVIVFTMYAVALGRAWALNGFDRPPRPVNPNQKDS